MNVTVVGIAGPAGSGKDTLADGLINLHGYQRVSFADPMYRIAKLVKAQKNGDKAAPFELFKLVLELFGGPISSPPLQAVTMVVVNDLPSIADDTNLYEDMASGTKPRAFLQYIGTEYFRGFDEDIWCNYLTNRICTHVSDAREAYFRAIETNETLLRIGGAESDKAFVQVPNVNFKFVITDVRFDNELEAIDRMTSRISDIAFDIFANKHTIQLALPREVAAQRVADRDKIDVETVLSRMGHASETGIDAAKFDTVIDASVSIEDMVDAAVAAIEGTRVLKTRSPKKDVEEVEMIPGSKIVDLSKYKKKENEDNG